MEFLNEASLSDLIKLQERSVQGGGDYREARALIDSEMRRRALAIQALGCVDMPVWDNLEGEGC